jgi:hypothetical protein
LRDAIFEFEAGVIGSQGDAHRALNPPA